MTDDMEDDPEKVIFYDGNVFLNLGASKKNTSQQSYIPGVLKICENKFGPYIIWEHVEKDSINETDGEWDVIGDDTNLSSNQKATKIKFINRKNTNNTNNDHETKSVNSLDEFSKLSDQGPYIVDETGLNGDADIPKTLVEKQPFNVSIYIGLKVIRFELYDIKCYRCHSPKPGTDHTKLKSNLQTPTQSSGSKSQFYQGIGEIVDQPDSTGDHGNDSITNSPPYFIFILKDGSTYPPFQFTDHECSDKFVDCLLKYLEIKRSYKENNMYIVKDHRAIALEKSFNELNLFSGKAEDFVSKFLKDPYTTTFNGFSKVAQFVYETLTIPPESGLEQGNGEDISTFLNHMISNNVDITQGESGFQMVTCSELPPRPDVFRSEPLGSREWNSYFNEEVGGQLRNPAEIKARIFRGGVSDNIRVDVWKYLLGYYPWDSNAEERNELKKIKTDEYFRIKLQWKTVTDEQEKNFTKMRERKSLIEKDVHRTDRTHPFFQGAKNPNLTISYDILMTYSMYNFDVGYVQGMSDLLTPILVVMENEVDAFWSFVGYMERMKQNFYMEQEAMKLQLAELYALLSFINPAFATYLDKHESGNLYFCFRWLLILFKREFPFSETMRLWEIIWTDLPCQNFHLLFCLAILEEEEPTIMENKFGLTEILKHINDIANTIDLDKMLKRAEGIYYQISICPELPAKISGILGIRTKPLANLTL